MNPPMQRRRNVFTFDTPSLTPGFGMTPPPPGGAVRMHFSQEGDRSPYSLMEPSLYPLDQPSSIDPYYTPDFRNQSLSDSFHPHDNFSSLRSRSLLSELSPLRANSSSSLLSPSQPPLGGLSLLPGDYYHQEDFLPHRPFSVSTSPSFARSPVLADPSHFDSRTDPSHFDCRDASHFDCRTDPSHFDCRDASHFDCRAASPTLKPPAPYSEPRASPSRPKRSVRSRGGSPGAPEPINELKIEEVRSGKDKRTTLMIKNIPNAWRYGGGVRRRFSRETVLGIIDKSCKDKYDFFYLPIDQKTGCNLGYGYINMTSTDSVVTLYEEVRAWARSEA